MPRNRYFSPYKTPPDRSGAPSGVPLPDCPEAIELLQLARRVGENRIAPDQDAAMKEHVQNCPYCSPRFQLMSSEFRIQLARQNEPIVSLESWSGPIRSKGPIQTVDICLQENGAGAVILRLLLVTESTEDKYWLGLKLLTESATGKQCEWLSRFDGHRFFVEFDPDLVEGWGFACLFERDLKKSSIVSATQAEIPNPLGYLGESIVLTHLGSL